MRVEAVVGFYLSAETVSILTGLYWSERAAGHTRITDT